MRKPRSLCSDANAKNQTEVNAKAQSRKEEKKNKKGTWMGNRFPLPAIRYPLPATRYPLPAIS